jgi:hypothetical protein
MRRVVAWCQGSRELSGKMLKGTFGDDDVPYFNYSVGYMNYICVYTFAKIQAVHLK